MKMNFNYTNNEKGFIFPFTLITVMILFLVLLTIVSRFENEIIMTETIQHHHIFESLFALAEDHKETNLPSESALPESNIYQYPQGKVTITYTAFHLYYTIQFTMTLNNGREYSVYQSYPWETIIEDTRLHDLNLLQLRHN